MLTQASSEAQTAGVRLVSVVIPTYDRASEVRVAIASALAQTHEHLEVIVVDDGSTDDTAALLRKEFGDRIRILGKSNGGVSSARNHGLAAARGEFIALLDSDDEWHPDHVAEQLALFARRPDLGMVITDVVRMDRDRRFIDHYRRRECIPVDGKVLPWVLRNPSLVPASAMIRREVYEQIGGFDESLRTAEDIEFHLRVALRFGIGVVEKPLTRAMRDHDGLSALPHTYADYVGVIERFVAQNADHIAPADRRAALLNAYARNARGILTTGQVDRAIRYAVFCAAQARSTRDVAVVGRLAFGLARGLAAQARARIRASG